MEIESWWLLAIPLFFGLGWFAARAEHRGATTSRGDLPDAYFRGLNFLLNEQPDKAIDAFIDVVRLDPETIELHFALGNLFRRRGETDRAIRVHQNLAERSGLDPRQREHAVFELGQDYLKAGLLDRAEAAFLRLEDSPFAANALELRLQIAQMVRDWRLAIEIATRLGRQTGVLPVREITHFHCELAAASLASHAPDGLALAQLELSAAVESDPAHPRPALLEGERALAAGDARAALQAWRALAERDQAWIALVARGWLAAHAALGETERGIETLDAIHRKQPSIDTFTAISEALSQSHGVPAALAWAEDALRRQPSLLGLDALLGLRLAVLEGERRDECELTRRLIQPQARRLARFLCNHCGFKARQFYWQCPGCSRWDTYLPKRAEEIER